MKFKQIMPWGKYLAAVDETGALLLIEIVAPGTQVQPSAPALVTHMIHFQSHPPAGPQGFKLG